MVVTATAVTEIACGNSPDPAMLYLKGAQPSREYRYSRKLTEIHYQLEVSAGENAGVSDSSEHWVLEQIKKDVL